MQQDLPSRHRQAAISVVLSHCGVSLVFAREPVPLGVRYGVLSAVTLWLLALVIAANAVAVFALAGFHWVLPDDPTGYELF